MCRTPCALCLNSIILSSCSHLRQKRKQVNPNILCVIDDRLTTNINETNCKVLSHKCQVLWKGDSWSATVVEIVVKATFTQLDLILHWCAHKQWAGYCGNAVINHDAEVVACCKNASNIKGMKTASSLSQKIVANFRQRFVFLGTFWRVLASHRLILHVYFSVIYFAAL